MLHKRCLCSNGIGRDQSRRDRARRFPHARAATLPAADERVLFKRLADIKRAHGAHDLVPIIDPRTDHCPFAVSLERCTAGQSITALAAQDTTCPMCELLYFMEGPAHVMVAATAKADRPPRPIAVASGDSILAPAGSVHIAVPAPSADARDAEKQLKVAAFIRVMLPLAFVLQDRQLEEVRRECSCAAQRVTEHWSAEQASPLSADAVASILQSARRSACLRSDSAILERPDPLESRRSPVRRAYAHAFAPAASHAVAPALNTAAAAGLSPKHPSNASWDITASEDDSRSVRQGFSLQQQLRPRLQQLANFSRVLPQSLRWVHALSAPLSEQRPVTKVSLAEVPSYQLPNQENRLALVMDPVTSLTWTDKVPFTFGVEVFPAGHKTPPHVHRTAHEMFFIISGLGEAFCNGDRFSVEAGDTIVFPPGSEHGIDAAEGAQKLYCLELMLPNEQFAELVRKGQRLEGLSADDMCILAALGCH